MNKIISLGFVIVSLINMKGAYAQPKEKIKFGIKYGVNIPLMKGENYFSTDLNYNLRFPSAINYYGGILLDVPVIKHLGIQTEVLYTTTGYDWYTPDQWHIHITNVVIGDKAVPDRTESLSFISIPLILKLKFGGLAIYAGPQWDKLLAATRKSNADNTPVKDVKKDYQAGGTFSGVAGIEYTFRFGLGISARYQVSLTNIAQATETGLYEEGNEVKNQLIIFGPYFKFGKPRKKK